MKEEIIKTVRLKRDRTVVEVTQESQSQPIVGQTDWKRVGEMSEEEIEAAARLDPDNPPLSEEELSKFSRIPNLREIRAHLKLSQKQFAQKFELSLRTIQDWEQGRSQPDQAAMTLLKIIAQNPEAVEVALKSDNRGK